MAYFVISFELRCGSEVTRRRLCNEIERLGGVEAISGLYMAELDGTVEEVRDYLSTFLGVRDRLIVVTFSSPPGTRLPLHGTEEWIADRVTAAEAV